MSSKRVSLRGVNSWRCAWPLAAAAMLALAGCRGQNSQPRDGVPAENGPATSRPVPRLGGAIPAERFDQVVSSFNRGVALMEQAKPVEAVEAFEDVVRLAPEWPMGHVNLGIALLNTEQPDDSPRAETEFKAVLAADSGSVHAHFALGVLLVNWGRFDDARPHFEEVLRIDPRDADSHYQMGILLRAADPAAARRHVETTLEISPHHQSACYLLNSLLRQLGDTEGADRMLARFNALKETGAGQVSGMKYGEMGRYAAVVRSIDLARSDSPSSAAPSLVNVSESLGLTISVPGDPGWPGENGGSYGPGLAVADVNVDGRLDFFLPGAGQERRGALFLGGVDGFSEASTAIDAPLAIGAFFGDYDRDGDPDLYLTCSGPNRLYRNDGRGAFEDVTSAAGVGGGDAFSRGACWADADHDGDLDLFVCNGPLADDDDATHAAPNQLFRNNGDGAFTEIGAGMFGSGAASVAWLDLDDDRDLDVVVAIPGGLNRILLNDRLGRFQDGAERFAALAKAGPALGFVVGDVDGDGRDDVFVLRGAQPPRLLLQFTQGEFREEDGFAQQAQTLGGAVNIVLGDWNLDGHLDAALLGVGSTQQSSHALLLGRGTGQFAPPVRFGQLSGPPAARGAVAADFDGDGRLELLVARAGGSAELWRPIHSDDSEKHWLEVIPDKVGERKENEVRPNVVGARIEAIAGRHRQVRSLSSASGFLSSPPNRAHFGLADRGKFDYVRLSWPDAEFQAELEVAANQHWHVAKQIKKASSCPVLFAWDGQRFAFVADFAGGGGLGFFSPPDGYAPPDPSEMVRIAPELIAPQDESYLLRVTEPLEEVTYLDQLQLVVYDHPAEWEVYPDERFGGAPPLATGRPLVIAERRLPIAARTERERDVREAVTRVDRRYVDPPPDPRFAGYAEDHFLEVDFGPAPLAGGADHRWFLLLHGWIEYTYSHVNVAAAQAGHALCSPMLETPDGRGGWQTAIPDIGFPAGLPRTMTVDVSSLVLAGQTRFRMRTNMLIYWDQVVLARLANDAPLVENTLDATRAELRPLGYPREYSPDGGEPTVYDYQRLDHGLPFKNLAGRLTRWGDVRLLLREIDDQFVIFGRGEELALEFAARSLPQLPVGWSRTVVLRTDGYCKDMDLYTAFPDTVEPLPYHAMPNYPPPTPRPDDGAYGEYLRTWNRREIAR